ncbi:MAG TPA: HAD hydrolase family protein, partial [Steroidobacteraceae bacterium]|nr:HAD hydrolase family protein [Steroidobacteraceae bacterium]
MTSEPERPPRDGPRIRLIALDLDGTLLSQGNAVSDADAAAVRTAVAAGVHIVLATSRWYTLAKRTADLLGITSPIICHNGAMVRSPIDGARLLDLPVPAAAAAEIAALADAERYDGMVSAGDVTYLVSKLPEIDPARLPAGMVRAQRLSDHARGEVEAFLFFGEEAVEGVRGRLAARYAGVVNMAWGHSRTFPMYLNVVHAAADKGRALALVCEHAGVPLAEAMA